MADEQKPHPWNPAEIWKREWPVVKATPIASVLCTLLGGAIIWLLYSVFIIPGMKEQINALAIQRDGAQKQVDEAKKLTSDITSGITGGNGFASEATPASTIGKTGWTNTYSYWAVIPGVAGVSVTQTNADGTGFSYGTISIPMTLLLEPGAKINGKSMASVGSIRVLKNQIPISKTDTRAQDVNNTKTVQYPPFSQTIPPVNISIDHGSAGVNLGNINNTISDPDLKSAYERLPDGRIMIGDTVSGEPTNLDREYRAGVECQIKSNYFEATTHYTNAAFMYDESTKIAWGRSSGSLMFNGGMSEAYLADLYLKASVSALYSGQTQVALNFSERFVSQANSVTRFRQPDTNIQSIAAFVHASALFTGGKRDEAGLEVDRAIHLDPSNTNASNMKSVLQKLKSQ